MISAYFITFEGGDGCGKSTQLALAERVLLARGVDVYCTRQPGATPLGVELRRLLLSGEFTPVAEAELLLFLADRAQHVQTCIRPALAAGQWVLCDRYSDSTLAYQLAARRLGEHSDLQPLLQMAQCGIEPDLTLWFDLPPAAALARVAQRQEQTNRLDAEALPFHQRVYDSFAHLAATTPRIQRIDARGTVAEVAQQVRTVLDAQCC
ncbi:MAG: dTMP kinase [Mariprofundaceae bacterium]|nr:dTMP kinase [Mariprofundaceae bacterium]